MNGNVFFGVITRAVGLVVVLCGGAACTLSADVPDPGADIPGWTLVWNDEFDGDKVDTDKWENLTRKQNHNNEIQYYLPEQALVADGMLIITTTNEPYDERDYRSSRLFSWHTQTYGRVEVRAKIPTTKGIWPAIWLVPRGVKWPTGGEIDIMEHKGSNPHMVSSAYHFANDQGQHTYQNHRYQPDPPVAFPDGFHLYAVEWDPGQIRFFVDGEEHMTVVGGYVSDTPMAVVLNTAVGGWFDGNPDKTTVFPQTFAVDYVRIWERTGPAPAPVTVAEHDAGLLTNGSFEDRSQGWVFSGNALHLPHIEARTPQSIAYEGPMAFAVKLWGDGRVSQDGVPVEPGKSYALSSRVRVNSDDSIFGTGNTLSMSLEFLDAAGNKLDTADADMVIADGRTEPDVYQSKRIVAEAPPSAATARAVFQFHRFEKDMGAVWIDTVALNEVE
ncbi:MAG: family 16 glycosylhydrolase [Phycisphaerales bacterium]